MFARRLGVRSCQRGCVSCARREALKIIPLCGSLVFQSGHQSRSNERAASRMGEMLREGKREEEAAACILCAWVELMRNLQGSAKRLCPCLVNFCSCCFLPLLLELACSIHTTLPEPFSQTQLQVHICSKVWQKLCMLCVQSSDLLNN